MKDKLKKFWYDHGDKIMLVSVVVSSMGLGIIAYQEKVRWNIDKMSHREIIDGMTTVVIEKNGEVYHFTKQS